MIETVTLSAEKFSHNLDLPAVRICGHEFLSKLTKACIHARHFSNLTTDVRNWSYFDIGLYYEGIQLV